LAHKRTNLTDEDDLKQRVLKMEPETVKECIEAVDQLIRQKEVEILRARLRKA
jgi:hypothetical protein